MKTTFVRAFALAVLAAAAASLPARAQESIYASDYSWGALVVGQCYAILFLPARLEFNWDGADITYSWTGGCSDEHLIEGSGVFTTAFTTLPNEWSPEPTHYRMENTVSASNGMFQGSSSEATFSDADDWDDSTPPGSMQWHDFGDVRNPMPSVYENGCSYYVDGDGAVDRSRTNFDCDAAVGAQFLDAFRRGDTSGMATDDSASSETSQEMVGQESGDPNLATAANGDAGGQGGCTLTSDESLARFEADFRTLTGQKPLPPTSEDGFYPGARDTYQYTYFLGVEGLKLLEPYRACLGPHEAPNDAQLREMVDKGLKGCEALSSAQGTCVPEYPF